MPSYAHLSGKLDCPACGCRLDVPHDLFAFQWGYCPSRQPWDELFYAVGDEIRWRVDDAGALPAWTYFDGSLQGGNLGDPCVDAWLVRTWDLGGSELVCAQCHHEGFALRIEKGRIAGLARAVSGCDIAMVRDDGEIISRPHWDDAAMAVTEVVASRTLTNGNGRVITGKQAP